MSQQYPDRIANLVSEKEFLEKQLDAIGKVNASLAGGLKPKAIFAELLKEALCLLDADDGALFLRQADADELTTAAVEGVPARLVREIRIRVGEGAVGWVAKTGQPLVLLESPPESRGLNRAVFGEVKDALLTPVLWQNEVLGVLYVGNKRRGAFREADIVPLLIFANQTASVLREFQNRENIDRSYLAMVTSLAEAVNAKDPYTFGHSKAVRDYSLVIGDKLGLDAEELRWLEMAAVLHDIGKLSIPDSILLKTSKLTPEEYAIIKTHPRVGAKMLDQVGYFETVAPIILHHHERCDGSGYPDGLRGEDIPLSARIMAIADAFDAMSSKRIYRRLLNTDEILTELKKGRGRQFDPHILDVFIAEFEVDRKIYRAGESRLAEAIHAEIDFYELAVRDNPEEIQKTVKLLADVTQSLILTLDKYAGPLVKDRIVKQLNSYSIENRLDFIVGDARPDVPVAMQANLVELIKRFQAYLDYLLTIIAGSLSAGVSKKIFEEATAGFNEDGKLLFKHALRSGHVVTESS